MSDAIESARRVLSSRLAEIEAETGKLRSALQSLGGRSATSSSSSAAPKPRRRRRAKRAPHGQRRRQFLAAAKSKPGSSAAELGKVIGISTTQAYALSQRLLKDGEVKKSGKGYKIA